MSTVLFFFLFVCKDLLLDPMKGLGKKYAIDSLELSPSTEIFSKRRKIYAFWRETRVTLTTVSLRAIPLRVERRRIAKYENYHSKINVDRSACWVIIVGELS